jgi:hypothetical protein
MSLYPAMCTLLIVVDRASALVETLPTTVLYLRPGEYQSLNIVVRLTALRRDGSSPRVSALASGLPLAVRLAHRMLGDGRSVREIAAALGLSRNAVRRFARAGRPRRAARQSNLARTESATVQRAPAVMIGGDPVRTRNIQ